MSTTLLISAIVCPWLAMVTRSRDDVVYVVEEVGLCGEIISAEWDREIILADMPIPKLIVK